MTFPRIVVSDKVHAYVIGGDGTVKQHELRLPKKAELIALVAIGDDLAVMYRDEKYQGHLFWASNPSERYEGGRVLVSPQCIPRWPPLLDDGSVFLGQQAVRPGDKELPQSQPYLHDGTRFWRVSHEYDLASQERRWKIAEVDPRTGKQTRESVPPWFEETEGGTIELDASELMPAPKGTESSPLGVKDGCSAGRPSSAATAATSASGSTAVAGTSRCSSRTVRSRSPWPSCDSPGRDGICR